VQANYEDIAKEYGYKDGKLARIMVNRLKRKMKSMRIAEGGGESDAAGDGGDDPPKRKKAVGAKRKVDGEPEMTTTKRGRPSKAEKRASVIAEEGEIGVDDLGPKDDGDEKTRKAGSGAKRSRPAKGTGAVKSKKASENEAEPEGSEGGA
jgi:hypothetical protein